VTTIQFRHSKIPPAPVACWQQDMTFLVLRDGCATPDRCVECNEPSDGTWYSRRYSPPRPNQYSGGGPGAIGAILGLIAVFMILTQPKLPVVRVHLAACAVHRSQRTKRMWSRFAVAGLGLLLIALAVTLILIRSAAHPALQLGIMVAGILCLMGGLFWGLLATRVLAFQHIHGEYVWLKGASDSFLGSLPSVRPAGNAPSG
jgi:hypothetical protein